VEEVQIVTADKVDASFACVTAFAAMSASTTAPAAIFAVVIAPSTIFAFVTASVANWLAPTEPFGTVGTTP
jgi:hypothetical protein